MATSSSHDPGRVARALDGLNARLTSDQPVVLTGEEDVAVHLAQLFHGLLTAEEVVRVERIASNVGDCAVLLEAAVPTGLLVESAALQGTVLGLLIAHDAPTPRRKPGGGWVA